MTEPLPLELRAARTFLEVVEEAVREQNRPTALIATSGLAEMAQQLGIAILGAGGNARAIEARPKQIADGSTTKAAKPRKAGKRRRRRSRVPESDVPTEAEQESAAEEIEAKPPSPPDKAGEGSAAGPVEGRIGLTVSVQPGEESIAYRDQVMDLDARQARLAAALTLAAPNFVGRVFLIEKVWGARPPESSDMMLSNLAAQLRKAVSGLGLDLASERGVGLALRPS